MTPTKIMEYAVDEDAASLRKQLDKANADLDALSRAVRSVLSRWREFEDVPLDGRRALYDAYLTTGGKPL